MRDGIDHIVIFSISIFDVALFGQYFILVSLDILRHAAYFKRFFLANLFILFVTLHLWFLLYSRFALLPYFLQRVDLFSFLVYSCSYCGLLLYFPRAGSWSQVIAVFIIRLIDMDSRVWRYRPKLLPSAFLIIICNGSRPLTKFRLNFLILPRISYSSLIASLL